MEKKSKREHILKVHKTGCSMHTYEIYKKLPLWARRLKTINLSPYFKVNQYTKSILDIVWSSITKVCIK